MKNGFISLRTERESGLIDCDQFKSFLHEKDALLRLDAL